MPQPTKTMYIPPPEVEHGTDSILLTVGPGDITGLKKDFKCHKNLLVAASGKLREVCHYDDGDPPSSSQCFHLTHFEPAMVQIFYDWLYRKRNLEQVHPQQFKPDVFWLLVNHLADYLAVPQLQVIAFQRFGACFTPSPPTCLLEGRQTLPSNELLSVLFNSGTKRSFLHEWIIDHLLWHTENPSKGFVGISKLLREFPALATEFGLAVATKAEQRGTKSQSKAQIYLHPNQDASWQSRHGIDLDQLLVETNTSSCYSRDGSQARNPYNDPGVRKSSLSRDTTVASEDFHMAHDHDYEVHSTDTTIFPSVEAETEIELEHNPKLEPSFTSQPFPELEIHPQLTQNPIAGENSSNRSKRQRAKVDYSYTNFIDSIEHGIETSEGTPSKRVKKRQS